MVINQHFDDGDDVDAHTDAEIVADADFDFVLIIV